MGLAPRPTNRIVERDKSVVELGSPGSDVALCELVKRIGNAHNIAQKRINPKPGCAGMDRSNLYKKTVGVRDDRSHNPGPIDPKLAHSLDQRHIRSPGPRITENLN